MTAQTKKRISSLLLLTFTWQFVIVPPGPVSNLKRLLGGSFRAIASALSPGEADAADYTVNRIPGNFVEISATGTAVSPALGYTSGVTGIPIGFTFNYFGTPYTTLMVTSQGYASFLNLISPANDHIPDPALPNGLVAPFWADLNPALNPASAAYYATVGTSPSRAFIVEWKNVPLKADPNSRLTFELVLFETTNEIQFHYLSMVDGNGTTGTGAVSGLTATIGVESSDGTKGTEVAYNQAGAIRSGDAFGFTLGGPAFPTGRLLGDLDGDGAVTILDQSLVTDIIWSPSQPRASLDLLLADIAPKQGTAGRAFGDGVINAADHAEIFQVVMGRDTLNPTLSAVAASGVNLTISGSGFDPVAANDTVTFRDVNGVLTSVVATSASADGTSLTVVVPAGAHYVTSVQVSRGTLASNPLAFFQSGVPILSGVFPNSGQAGDLVTIEGYQLGTTPAANQVSFNGVAATVSAVNVNGPSIQLAVTVPAGATSGPLTVTAGGKVSNALTFGIVGPPVVAIASPADVVDPQTGQATAPPEIKAATPVVGTAVSSQLANYVLEYAPFGSSSYTQFASGTQSVSGGTLGTLDPSLLVNGLFHIRLTATDTVGRSSSITQDVLISGQNKPGIFTVTFTDLQTTLGGVPVTVNRTYDSRTRGSSLDFGNGWKVEVVKSGTYTNNIAPGQGWSVQLTGIFGVGFICAGATPDLTHVTEVRFSDSEFYRFAPVIALNQTEELGGGYCDGTAGYTQIAGVPGATLTPLGDNYVLCGQGECTDASFNTYQPQAVRLTTLDGRKFDLDLQAGLTAVTDPNGNALTINSAGITSSSGGSIAFARDAQGRITQITTPSGGHLLYSYVAGNLDTSKDRAGNASTYEYDAGHYLLKIQDPLGNTPVTNEYDATGRLVAQTDAAGHRTTIGVDLANNTTTVHNADNKITTLVYDASGQVTSLADNTGADISRTFDANGNKTSETRGGFTWTYTYDANNNLTSETDPRGKVITYAYNAQGQPTSTGWTAADGTAKTMAFTYDAKGNPLSIVDSSGTTVNSFTYDASGRPATVTGAGGATTLTYDASGNLSQRQGPAPGQVVTYTYDADGNVLTQTSPRTTSSGVVNEVTSFTYDANGRKLTMTDPLGNVTKYAYDADGDLISQTDARNNVTSFQYDANGNLFKKTYPDGTYETFGYDLENRLNAQTDRAGRATFYEYDTLGKQTTVLYPDGGQISTIYDLAGNASQVQDPLGNVTTFEHDGAGNLTKITSPLGKSTLFGYGSVGARTSVTDPLGRVTHFAYDEGLLGLARPTVTTFADASTTQRSYDPSGKAGSDTDELGRATAYQYDAAGRLTKVADALGGMTQFTYDEAGNVRTQTDAKGHVTTLDYDANHKLVKRTRPDGKSESMTYDAVGNLLTKTDFMGRTVTYTYDSMNRPTRKDLPGGAFVTWTYTPTGQVSTVVDGRGTTSYTYDLRDRVASVTNPDGTFLDYTYDKAGNRTSVQSGKGVTVYGTTSYAYDAANRLSAVTDPNSKVTSYTYDDAGNLVQVAYPNGTVAALSYDARNRLTEVKHVRTAGGTVLAQFDYVLDATGNRTQVTKAGGAAVTYTYDALHRLLSESDGATTTTYAYDAVGNRVSKNGAAYSYDTGDRLLSGPGLSSAAYDDNGNLVSRTTAGGTTTYTWDPENRLIGQLRPGGLTSTFAYDAYGIRVGRNSTKYLVDPADPSGYPQVLAALDGTGALQKSYVYGLGRLSQQPVAGAASYYHPDALGSTRLLTGPAGLTTDTYDYDAFGNLVASAGTTPNEFLFDGEQQDPDLGFYYLRARYLDPSVGRFVSADPYSGSISDPATLHRYLYARNNPANRIDPGGQQDLMSLSISVNIIGILAAISVGYNLVYKPAKDAYDKLNKLLTGIPKMPLNEKATRKDLLTLTFDPKNIADPTKIVNLGGGAVDQAYGVIDAMAAPAGKWVNALWKFDAALWMSYLPEVKNIPGNYLACSFNEYVQKAYALQLVVGLSAAKFVAGAANIIAMYLSYFTFLALVEATADDWVGGGVPRQPACGSCGCGP